MTDIETYEHDEDGIEEVWVADPCGGAFGGGSSEIRVFHVETSVIDAAADLIELWETELASRDPERVIKPEFLFAV